jgi:hypothetical protein
VLSPTCGCVINSYVLSDVPLYQYAVKVGDFQWVRIPPGQSVARPEAIRAAQEVTNTLKYPGVTGHYR